MFSKCRKLLFKVVTLFTETKAGVIQVPCIENGWYKFWGNIDTLQSLDFWHLLESEGGREDSFKIQCDSDHLA